MVDVDLAGIYDGVIALHTVSIRGHGRLTEIPVSLARSTASGFDGPAVVSGRERDERTRTFMLAQLIANLDSLSVGERCPCRVGYSFGHRSFKCGGGFQVYQEIYACFDRNRGP